MTISCTALCVHPATCSVVRLKLGIMGNVAFSHESRLLAKVKDVPFFRAPLALVRLARRWWGLRGGHASIGAALRVRMLSGTFYGGNVTTVPHAGPAQLTQVVQTARDPGKQPELIEKASCLGTWERTEISEVLEQEVGSNSNSLTIV